MKHKVIIEATAIGLPLCGLHEYAAQLCPRLIAGCPEDIELTFIVPPGKTGCFGLDVKYIEAYNLNIPLLRTLPLIKADLFHAMHQLCRVYKLPGAKRTLMTVHDINFAHTRTGRKLKQSTGRFIKRLRHADYLAFISHYAEEDVDAHFPNDIPARVIYNGVTPPDAAKAVRPQGVPDGPFLLHLSSLVPYKNPHLLVEMMDSLPERTLIMAGHCTNTLLNEMAARRKNVVMLGSVTDDEKTWLYEHCDAFLFPSNAEGFGLPPMEAMLMGKPVFLSTRTCLPEIGGSAAFYWHDLIPAKMATELEQHLSAPIDPQALSRHAAQFSWDACATAYLRYYHDILFGKINKIR